MMEVLYMFGGIAVFLWLGVPLIDWYLNPVIKTERYHHPWARMGLSEEEGDICCHMYKVTTKNRFTGTEETNIIGY